MLLCEAEKKYKINYPEAFRKAYESGAMPWLNHDNSWIFRNESILSEKYRAFFRDCGFFVIPFSDIDRITDIINKRLVEIDEYKYGLLQVNPDYIFIPFAKLHRENNDALYFLVYARKNRDYEPIITIYYVQENVMHICADNYVDFAARRTQKPVWFSYLIPVPKQDSESSDFFDSATNEQFIIKSNGKNIAIDFDEIRYVSADNKSLCVHIKDKTLCCNKLLSYAEKSLPDNRFYRCHKSFVIGFKHIIKRVKNEIVFDNGGKAIISKNKLDEFKELYEKYLNEKI